jgi:hypothetical protein
MCNFNLTAQKPENKLRLKLYAKSPSYLQLHHLKLFKMQLATSPFFTYTAVTYDSYMMLVDVISKQCSAEQALLPDATILSAL